MAATRARLSFSNGSADLSAHATAPLCCFVDIKTWKSCGSAKHAVSTPLSRSKPLKSRTVDRMEETGEQAAPGQRRSRRSASVPRVDD